MAQFGDSSLLHEALNAKHDELPFLTLEIWPLSSNVRNVTVTELMKTLRGTGRKGRGDYFWNDGDGPLHERFVISRECLKANVGYGDNVQDIWACLAVLLEITGKVPECAATMRDSVDGEIMLVEAAEVIPDWLEPDNSMNRVWVKGGGIDILRGGDRSAPLSANAAVEELKGDKSAAPRRVTDALKAKAAEALKTKNEHRALLSLPRDIAGLVRKEPTIVNKAIECFYTGGRAVRDKVKAKKAAKVKADRGPDVDVIVRFTRCLFAKLSFQRTELEGEDDVDIGAKLASAVELWTEEEGVEVGVFDEGDFKVEEEEKGSLDSLGWLNVGGMKEFDNLMKQATSGGFDEVAEKMKGFVGGISEYDGVEGGGGVGVGVEVGVEGRGVSETLGGDVDSGSGEGDVDIDPEKFLKILEGAVGGSGDKYFGNDKGIDVEDKDDDDEEEDDEGGNVGEPERTEIDDEVDAIKGNDATVDVDVSVVSNLIESVLGEGGSTGPAGNVLKQLGVNVPNM